MNRKLILGVIAAILAALLGFIYTLQYFGTRPKEMQPGTPVAAPAASHEPGIRVKVDNSTTITIEWNNLPDGTVKLLVYRAKKGTEDWKLWKTIVLKNGEQGGSFSFNLSTGDAYSYKYYGQAVSENGNSAWKGAPFEAQPTTPETEIPPQSQSPINFPSNSTPTPATNSSSAQSSASIPSEPSSPALPSSPTSATSALYYTPSIQPSSNTDPTPKDDFWVQHTSNYIEIGWQNLSASATRVIVYRASDDTGLWSSLLNQQITSENRSFVIRLLDNSLNTPHYYKMETYSDADIMKTYGPILLPALR